jgi:hypothetical protein
MSNTTPTATKIMVIRHAEKPADSGSPFGVTTAGEQDAESLIVQGWQRAGALATLFAPSRGPLQSPELAIPQFLYASGIAKHSSSLRPQETITPLRDKLSLSINTTYLKGDEQAMVDDAVSQSGIVLICWEHQAVPEIANFILGNNTTVPQKWPGDRFDLVWVFDLNSSNSQYGFTQVPQLLLAGDSNTIIE